MNLVTTRQVYYSNVDAETVNTGIGAIAQLGSAIASRPKRQLSEAEQRCGKRPRIGKRKKQAWQQCVNKASARVSVPSSPSVETPPPSTGNKNKTLMYVGIGVVVLAVVGVVIYKMRKK